MARCQKYDEDECHGHDCIDRVGTPCVHDNFGVAGTEDIEIEDYDEEAAVLRDSHHRPSNTDVLRHI
jgi:hypothetical protein